MVRLVPLFSMVFNFYFLYALDATLAALLPSQILPFNGLIRSLIIFFLIICFLYMPFGQRCVAFFVRGRNTIGREEKILEPIIEQLKDRTDIRGYSAPVWFQFLVFNALNNITLCKISSLNRRVNQIKYEYKTGTVKIFTFDSLDIESNSYGNTIFISKGAIDTLTKGELTAVIYNEFAQIKHNISNKRLLHDAGVLIGRACSTLLVFVAPFAFIIGLIRNILPSLSSNIGNVSSDISLNAIFFGFVLALSRMLVITILFMLKLNFTQMPYMFYERKIFVDADRATHQAGFSADMADYLEKLYYFKLNRKDLSKLFVELRPLVAYRLNFFDNLLGKNRDLSQDNYAWSSNYMERVQTINNTKQ